MGQSPLSKYEIVHDNEKERDIIKYNQHNYRFGLSEIATDSTYCANLTKKTLLSDEFPLLWIESNNDEPPFIDLRVTSCFPYPEVKDQGNEGSCVAFSMNTALICEQRPTLSSNYENYLLFDENYLFQDIREKQNVTRPESNGLTFSEVAQGICQYQVENSSSSKNSSIFGSTNVEMPGYWRRVGISVQNFRSLLNQNHPIVLGISVSPQMRKWQQSSYRMKQNDFVLPQSVVSTYSLQAGNVAAIKQKISQIINKENGFHCILLIGYDDSISTNDHFNIKEKHSPGVFIARNSWGSSWGHSGHFYIPYEVIGTNFHDPSDNDYITRGNNSGKVYVFGLDAMIFNTNKKMDY